MPLVIRSSPSTSSTVSGTQITTCTQKGGSAESWRAIAPPVTMVPTISVRKAAGPSPTLNAAMSSPQARQRGAKRISPSNSVRAPQRGHSP